MNVSLRKQARLVKQSYLIAAKRHRTDGFRGLCIERALFYRSLQKVYGGY